MFQYQMGLMAMFVNIMERYGKEYTSLFFRLFLHGCIEGNIKLFETFVYAFNDFSFYSLPLRQRMCEIFNF